MFWLVYSKMNAIIVFIAEYVFILSPIIAGMYWLFLEKKKKVDLGILTIISFSLTYISAKVFALFIHDPRPFVVEHIKPLIAHSADNGFPSDHTLLTSAIASVVFVYNKKLGIALFFLSSAIGVARVLAKVHHPFDIIGAMFIAIVATSIAFFLVRLFKKILRVNR